MGLPACLQGPPNPPCLRHSSCLLSQAPFPRPTTANGSTTPRPCPPSSDPPSPPWRPWPLRGPMALPSSFHLLPKRCGQAHHAQNSSCSLMAHKPPGFLWLCTCCLIPYTCVPSALSSLWKHHMCVPSGPWVLAWATPSAWKACPKSLLRVFPCPAGRTPSSTALPHTDMAHCPPALTVSPLGPLPLTCHELRIVCHSVLLSHVECGGRCPCPRVLRAQHRACCSPGVRGVPPGGLRGKGRAGKACGCGQMVAEACAGALGSSAVSPPPPPIPIPAHTSPSAPSQSPSWSEAWGFQQTSPCPCCGHCSPNHVSIEQTDVYS